MINEVMKGAIAAVEFMKMIGFSRKQALAALRIAVSILAVSVEKYGNEDTEEAVTEPEIRITKAGAIRICEELGIK